MLVIHSKNQLMGHLQERTDDGHRDCAWRLGGNIAVKGKDGELGNGNTDDAAEVPLCRTCSLIRMAVDVTHILAS